MEHQQSTPGKMTTTTTTSASAPSPSPRGGGRGASFSNAALRELAFLSRMSEVSPPEVEEELTSPPTVSRVIMRRHSSHELSSPTMAEEAFVPLESLDPQALVVLNRTSSFSRIVYDHIDRSVSVTPRARTPKKKSSTGSVLTVSFSGNEGAGDISLPPTTPGEATGEDAAKQPQSSARKMSSSSKRKSSAGSPSAPAPFMVKLGIMLSRSSGRDKFAALLQYGSMFCGNQTLVAVSQARDAPWRLLEDSMSTGRKTLRLFKWIKEFERMQRAYSFPDPGPHHTDERAKVAGFLGLFMHSFSFAYYFIDNILYMSQVGLINRPNVIGTSELRKMLKSGLPHDEYMKLQRRYRLDETKREASRRFEESLRDSKNYSSLGRLLFAIVYCLTQIDSANQTIQALDGDKPEDAKKIRELKGLKDENVREIAASVCNLVILLNRLKFGVFAKVPLWAVGVLGMIAAGIGLDKNWPKAAGSIA